MGRLRSDRATVRIDGADVPAADAAVGFSGSGAEREVTQRLRRILRHVTFEDGTVGRALLYEVVTADTADERVARRRR